MMEGAPPAVEVNLTEETAGKLAPSREPTAD
jgi:hypothetical protein